MYITRHLSYFICVEPLSLEPPCILKEVENCNAVEGEAGKFSCCISGNPTPDVCWYKDNEKLQESRQFTMLVKSDENYVLVITHSTPGFEGCYTCEATNSEGSVKSSGNLSVESMHEESALSHSEDLCEKNTVEIKKENAEDYYTLLQELGR